jgi:hypothetical protein
MFLFHADHGIPQHIVDAMLVKYADKTAFFTATEMLDIDIPMGIYGPIAGDPVVTEEEVQYVRRGNRSTISRMIEKPMRQTRELTIIGGPVNDAGEMAIYTMYGGPCAEKEPENSTNDQTAEIKFWSQHALSKGNLDAVECYKCGTLFLKKVTEHEIEDWDPTDHECGYCQKQEEEALLRVQEAIDEMNEE